MFRRDFSMLCGIFYLIPDSPAKSVKFDDSFCRGNPLRLPKTSIEWVGASPSPSLLTKPVFMKILSEPLISMIK